MTTTRQTHIARSRFSRMPTPELVRLVGRTRGSPNVRLMEELLSRCRAREEGVVAGLTDAVAGAGAERGSPSQPVWLAVVAGEMRWARAAAALLRMLRAVPLDDYVAGLAAAEALAKIGGPAVDGLVEVVRDGEWWQRVWAYASLGWNPAPRAREALVRNASLFTSRSSSRSSSSRTAARTTSLADRYRPVSTRSPMKRSSSGVNATFMTSPPPMGGTTSRSARPRTSRR
jgi:hypothetical protein